MVGLSVSKERVLAVLRGGALRAHDVADRLGVDTSAVRRHLDQLIALQLVEPFDVVQGPGRPKRFFRMTPAGRETGPRNYPLLLAELMRKVAEGEGRKQLFRYLEAIAADLAGPSSKGADAKRRLDLLLAKYNSLGFEAEALKDGTATVLVQRNCPFLAAAAGDPEALCEHLDEGLIRAALPGRKVRLDAALSKGAPFCRHIIEAARADGPKGTV